jgi:tetratricopeptide (TPR) repeat protein
VIGRGLRVALVMCAASIAHAEDRLSDAAKAHMDRGLAEYGAKNYEAAVIEFQAAYAIEPRREILFAWGQAERLRGDCPRALTLYRQFLGLSPPTTEAQRARERITECERIVEQSAAQEGSNATPPTVDDARPSTAGVSSVEPLPWYREGVGATLVGLGTISAATGVTLLALSQRDIMESRFGEFDAAVTRAHRQYIGGLASAIAGGILIGVGAIRVATAKSPRAPSLSFRVEPSGTRIVAIGGMF